MMRALAPLVALAAAACSGEPAPPGNSAEPIANAAADASSGSGAAPAAAPATPALAVDADGLRLFDRARGAARPLAFDTPQADVLAALAFRGPPATGRQEECGPGPLDFAVWPDGLKLYFQDGRLAGWALDGRAAKPSGSPALGTVAGIGPGSTRAELEAAHDVEVMQSSLGTEFASGAMAGVLDGRGPSARITDLWAGAACVMR